MSNKFHFKLSSAASLAVATLILSGCKTADKDTLVAPSLSYKTATVCTQDMSFDGAFRRTDIEKRRKREMRHRKITLIRDMSNLDVPCLEDPNVKGERIPYRVFEIPTGLDKRVVNAGSNFDEAVIFAADVTTHDENGAVVRQFDKAEYRRLGSIYGVQFSPRETEKYVVIKADPSLVGQQEETVETETRTQYVSTYGVTGHGGGGNNTRGLQKSYIRTYSYNGKVVVQTVFPKQKTKP